LFIFELDLEFNTQRKLEEMFNTDNYQTASQLNYYSLGKENLETERNLGKGSKLDSKEKSQQIS